MEHVRDIARHALFNKEEEEEEEERRKEARMYELVPSLWATSPRCTIVEDKLPNLDHHATHVCRAGQGSNQKVDDSQCIQIDS